MTEEIFTGQDFYLTIEFKDGDIQEKKEFAKSKSQAIRQAKKTYNGKNGLKRVINVEEGTKWYRETN